MFRTVLTSLLLLFTLLANAQEQEYIYRKVTSQSQIEAGGVYVLARGGDFFYFASGYSSNKITATQIVNQAEPSEFYQDDAYEMQLEKVQDENGYRIKIVGEDKYLQLSISNPKLVVNSFDKDIYYFQWDIKIDEETSKAKINPAGHGVTTNYIAYNSGFTYSTSSSPTILYRKYPVTPPTTTEQVSVGTSGYATLCCNKDLDFTGSSIHAYIGKLSGNVLTLQEVKKVKANEGVILYTEGMSVTADVNSVTMTSEENEAFPQNDLRGVSAETGVTVDNNGMYYALRDNGNDVGFYPISTNVVIPKGKAYLHIPGTSETHAKISFGFLTPTSITAPRQIRDGKTYNLSGQTVNSNYRGITITNGRKSLRK